MRRARFIITTILFILLYLAVFPRLFREWFETDDYSHGFLIPLISIYFLWRKRAELKNTPVSGSAGGIFFIAAGLILYILAKTGSQFFLQACSMLIVLFGLVYAQAGPSIAKKTAFSIAYLIFMIPLPQLVYTTITFHLGLFSTKLTYFLIRALGISAAREGNIIDLPTCRLIVATPCSGLRSLIVFMAASLAIGYIFQKSIAKRALLFGIGIALAVLMNTLRLTVTAFIANMLKLKAIPPVVHDRTGIAVVILGFILLFLINDFLAKRK